MCEAHGQRLQVPPRHPGFPHAMFDGLYVLSPVSGVDCHRCLRDILPQNRRHGRGARTTRLRRTLRTFRLARIHAPDAAASIASRATFRDDRATSLLAARGVRHILRFTEDVKWWFRKSEYMAA